MNSDAINCVYFICSMRSISLAFGIDIEIAIIGLNQITRIAVNYMWFFSSIDLDALTSDDDSDK